MRPLEASYQRDLQALTRMRERLARDQRIPEDMRNALIAGVDLVYTVAHLAPQDHDLAKQALDKKFNQFDRLVTSLRTAAANILRENGAHDASAHGTHGPNGTSGPNGHKR